MKSSAHLMASLPKHVFGLTAFCGPQIIKSGAATIIFPSSERYDKIDSWGHKQAHNGININTYSNGFGALLKLPSNTLMTICNQRSDAITSSDNSPEGGDIADMQQPMIPASIYFSLLQYYHDNTREKAVFDHNETIYMPNNIIGALFIGPLQRCPKNEFESFRDKMQEELGCKEAYVYDGGNLFLVGANNKLEKLPSQFFADFISADSTKDVKHMQAIESFCKYYISQVAKSAAGDPTIFRNIENIMDERLSQLYRTWVKAEIKKTDEVDIEQIDNALTNLKMVGSELLLPRQNFPSVSPKVEAIAIQSKLASVRNYSSNSAQN